MKSNILSFILGCCFIILTAATTIKADLLTVKPARPISTVVLYLDAQDSQEIVKGYCKLRYIVRQSSIRPDGRVYLILEKYD